jgi:CTP-dependent riboflavin kinase
MRFSKRYWGTVSSGSQNSTKWMPSHFPHLFPGTVNIKLDIPMPKIAWEQELETHYEGPCRIARCKINGTKAYLINPPNVGIDPPRYLAEVGSEIKLRNLLKLKDGSRVAIRFWVKSV